MPSVYSAKHVWGENAHVRTSNHSGGRLANATQFAIARLS